MKKKVTAKTRRSGSPKRVALRSKKWALLGVLVLLLTIPMTIALVAQSQDIRQEASTTYVSAIQITTMPTDILKISISQQNGNAQQDDSSGSNNNSENPQSGSGGGGQQSGGGGSDECEVEDTTKKDVGGMMRTININCDGQNQSDDQSGSDGNNQMINSGGKDNQVSQPKGTKNAKEVKVGKNNKTGKKEKKSQQKNFIQQFIDNILNRQGR